MRKGLEEKHVRRQVVSYAPVRYKYTYHKPHRPIVDRTKLQIGAKYRFGQGQDAGHYEVTNIAEDGKVSIAHDTTGHVATMTPEQLQHFIGSGQHSLDQLATRVKKAMNDRTLRIRTSDMLRKGEGDYDISMMTEDEIEHVLEQASTEGHQEGADPLQVRHAWQQVWKRLFAGIQLESPIPGNVDPLQVHIDYEVLHGPDLHRQSFITYKDIHGRIHTLGTREKNVRVALHKWEKLALLMKSPEVLQGMGQAFHEGFQNPKNTDRQRDANAILSIIFQTGGKRGTYRNMQERGLKGITTIHPRDLETNGDHVILHVSDHADDTVEVEDPVLAEYLVHRQRGSLRHGNPTLFLAGDIDVEKAFDQAKHQASPEPLPWLKDIKIKDLRTLIASAHGASLLEASGPPKASFFQGEGGTAAVPLHHVLNDGISVPDGLTVAAKHLLHVSHTVGQLMDSTYQGTEQSYLHPELIYAWLHEHHLDDLVPPHMDDYLRLRQDHDKTVEKMEQSKKEALHEMVDNLHQGPLSSPEPGPPMGAGGAAPTPNPGTPPGSMGTHPMVPPVNTAKSYVEDLSQQLRKAYMDEHQLNDETGHLRGSALSLLETALSAPLQKEHLPEVLEDEHEYAEEEDKFPLPRWVFKYGLSDDQKKQLQDEGMFDWKMEDAGSPMHGDLEQKEPPIGDIFNAFMQHPPEEDSVAEHGDAFDDELPDSYENDSQHGGYFANKD